jgi:ABC-2 type transport system ATP-binding protein
MSHINVENITKSFGEMRAVDDVSFTVEAGEIFGLLGPNGAGKTTSIRIILDIFKPDSGSVAVLGGPMSESKKNAIGYLPEERGLYQDVSLERGLIYLATLKGLSTSEAKNRMSAYLERFDLDDHRKKKIKELSKGMQQKAQLIATLIHQPQLIIIDEPFTALDPVNTQMVKDLLVEERNRGCAVVMCTHQMHQVEALCDRLVLINKGKSVLYGTLAEIQRQYAGMEVDVRSEGALPDDLSCVIARKKINGNGSYRLTLVENTDPQELLKELIARGIRLEQFEVAMPTLDEIFIKVVKGEGVQDE